MRGCEGVRFRTHTHTHCTHGTRRTNGHHAVVGKDLLGEVVDELAVDEAVDAVVDDLHALLAHLLLLRGLDLCHLRA